MTTAADGGPGGPATGSASASASGTGKADTSGGAATGTGADTTSGGTGPSDTGGDATGTSGGRAACGSGNICVPAIPAMWNGPVATAPIAVDGGLPDCGGSYSNLAADLYGSLSGDDPPACTCDCEVANASCSGSVHVEVTNNAGANPSFSPCGEPGGVNGLLDETVVSTSPTTYPPSGVGSVPYGAVDDVHGVTVTVPTMSSIAVNGSCTPNATGTPVPPASFGERFAVCGGQEADGACDGTDICVPQPNEPYLAPVCIWADGDQTCPAAYPQKQLLYEGFTDTRDCTTCTCGGIAADCNNPTLDLRWWVTVNGSTSETFAHTFDVPNTYCEAVAFCGFCVTGTVSVDSLTLDPGTVTYTDPTAPCPPSGGDPTGSVTLDGETTVCCTA